MWHVVTNYHYLDYIVERGTEGVWYYEKWSSGKAECRTVFSKNYSFDRSYLNGYLALNQIAEVYPFAFTSVPAVFIDGSGDGFVLSVVHQWSSVAQMYASPWTNTSGTKLTNVNAHIIGTWK